LRRQLTAFPFPNTSARQRQEPPRVQKLQQGENWHEAEDTSDEERTTVVSVHFDFDFSAGGITGAGTLSETHKYDVTSRSGGRSYLEIHRTTVPVL
jgi:hypothetical protein